MGDYTCQEFVRDFEDTCTPCIIRGAMEGWAATGKWTSDFIKRNYGDVRLKCGEDDDGNKVMTLKQP